MPKGWITSSPSRVRRGLDETPDDLGGYGSVDDNYSPSRSRSERMTDVRSSARRTGDRDDRGKFGLISYLLLI